jgi:hypothetical protein
LSQEILSRHQSGLSEIEVEVPRKIEAKNFAGFRYAFIVAAVISLASSFYWEFSVSPPGSGLVARFIFLLCFMVLAAVL